MFNWTVIAGASSSGNPPPASNEEVLGGPSFDSESYDQDVDIDEPQDAGQPDSPSRPFEDEFFDSDEDYVRCVCSSLAPPSYQNPGLGLHHARPNNPLQT
jgi:hypothetical protein